MAVQSAINNNNVAITGGSISGVNGVQTTGQFSSSVAPGTPPLIVSSNTVVPNLNADLLDGQHGSYYLDISNYTGILPVGSGGTGLSTLPTNGQLLIGNGANFALGTLTGTANQVNVTNGVGTVTLGLPQNIHTGATPTFAGITTTGGTCNIGNGVSTTGVAVQIGNARTASGYAFLDMIGDTTYTDYGLRVLRGNGGANTLSQVLHRGTGQLQIGAVDAGSVVLVTQNLTRLTIDAAGNLISQSSNLYVDNANGLVGIGAAPAAGAKLDIAGNVRSSGQLISTVATGTAPLSVASSTIVPNLNAALLNGQSGAYYTNASNLDAGTVPDARISGSYTGITDLQVSGDIRSSSQNGGPLAGLRNAIINGNFDVWQRGATFSGSTSRYTADRWALELSGGVGSSESQQAFTVGQTSVPGEPIYFIQVTTDGNGNAASAYVMLRQKIEDVRKFAGQTVTLSFYVKSPGFRQLSVEFEQNFGTGGSTAVTAIGATKISPTDVWSKVALTVSIPSISGKTIGTNSFLAINFWLIAGSDYNARTQTLNNAAIAGLWHIAQVQLEAGSVATPFEQRPIGMEMALCQRYYEKSYTYGVAPGANVSYAYGIEDLYANTGLSVVAAKVRFATAKRIMPTITTYDSPGNSGKVSVLLNGAITDNVTPSAVDNAATSGFKVWHSQTNLQRIWFHWAASAEL